MKHLVGKRNLRFTIPALILVLLLLLYLLRSNNNNNNNSNDIIHSVTGRPLHPSRAALYVASQCVTPFNQRVGYSFYIPAFSNCHRRWISEQQAYSRLGFPDDIRKEPSPGWTLQPYQSTGNCWDALEYVARFYKFHRGIYLYFPADDMEVYWGSLEFSGASGNNRVYETIEINNFVEGKTRKERKRLSPKFADIIVWSSNRKLDFRRGHMAVVVDVEDDIEFAGGEEKLHELQKERLQPQIVYIAEQNFDNKDWEGKNYSRILKFHWKNGKEAVLQDPSGLLPIIGRVRSGKLKKKDLINDDL